MSADTESIADVFTTYGEELKRRARRILGSEADADDAVQEVMLTLLSAPHVLSAVGRLAGWLVTVVRRRCVDLIRSDVRRKAREAARGIQELFAGSDDPAALMEREEVARLVAEAVADLPEPLRYPFVGNVLDGLTFREMSEQSGVPMGTLMARKKKAVDTLRARLRRRGLVP